MKARPARTYRGARRNRAKQVIRDNKLKGTTVGDTMEPGPVAPTSTASLIPRRVFLKVSAKVYRGGNIPGGLRRRMDRG